MQPDGANFAIISDTTTRQDDLHTARTDTPMKVDSVERPASRRIRSYWWFLAATPFLIAAFYGLQGGPGLAADDHAQYLLHAQALADGRPYSDIPYVYSPYARWIGPKSAMPGLPALVSVVFRLGGDAEVARLLLLGLTLAFLVLAGRYFAREANVFLGLGVLLLSGLTPGVVHSSTQVLTDLPFAACVWAVIWFADKPGPFDMRRIALLTGFGLAAITFRTAGLALMPALALFTLLNWREHKLRPLVPVVLWLVGFVILVSLFERGALSVVRFGPDFLLRWLRITQFGLLNVPFYAKVIPDFHLHPFASGLANNLFHVVTATVMLVGLLSWIVKSFRKFSVSFLVAQGSLLLVVPAVSPRYAWVLIPFFTFGLLNGVHVLLRLLPAAKPHALRFALAFGGLLALAGMRPLFTEPLPRDLMEEPAVHAVIQHLRSTGGNETTRVTFYKPRSFALATGIPTMGPIQGRPAECLMAELVRKRITHVILGRLTPRGRRVPRDDTSIRELVVRYPEAFILEYRSDPFNVYDFRPGDPNRWLNACPK